MSARITAGVNLSANERSRNIGGIAGTNTGTVTGCMNSAEIGYLHTGYNVGGIAGSTVALQATVLTTEMFAEDAI